MNKIINQKGVVSFVIILIVVGVLAIGGGAAYYLYKISINNDINATNSGLVEKNISTAPQSSFSLNAMKLADIPEKYAHFVRIKNNVVFAPNGRGVAFEVNAETCRL